MFSLVWVGSIVATIVLADRKNLNTVWFFFLSLCLGPIALIIVFLSQARANNLGLSSTRKLTPQEAHQELLGIKTSLNLLMVRLERIEAVLKEDEPTGPVVYPSYSAADQPMAETNPTAPNVSAKETMEVVFGKYWLNRIGVVLFVIGIGLFINYTFQYFSAWAKIAIGYVIAAIFLLWGQKLEKAARYQKLSWGILGGAWGIFYLVTYAMFYVPATKLIHNSYVELALLWVVTVCAIQYNLKYRSWVATAMSYFLGFVTIGLAGVDATSVMFWAMLVGSLVYLACRFDWDELLSAGMMGAYGIYVVALKDKSLMVNSGHSGDFAFHMSLIAIAWLFFMGAFLFQQRKHHDVSLRSIQRMIINTAAFVVCGCFLIEDAYRDNHTAQFNFIVMVAAGHALASLYSRVSKSSRYIVFHGVTAILLVSTAVFIKYQQLSVTYWWILQMVMMFVLGIYYREGAYRCMGWVLSVGVILRFFFVDLHSSYVCTWGALTVPHALMAAAFIALTFFTLGIVLNKPSIQECLTSDERKSLLPSLPFMGTLIVTGWLWKNSASRWLTLHLSLVGLSLLTLGFVSQYRAMRWCALSLFALCCLRILFFDLAGVDTIYKIIVVIFLGAVMLGVSLVYSKTK